MASSGNRYPVPCSVHHRDRKNAGHENGDSGSGAASGPWTRAPISGRFPPWRSCLLLAFPLCVLAYVPLPGLVCWLRSAVPVWRFILLLAKRSSVLLWAKRKSRTGHSMPNMWKGMDKEHYTCENSANSTCSAGQQSGKERKGTVPHEILGLRQTFFPAVGE